MISFMKNEKGLEMGNIGVVEFKAVGGYDLNEFRLIDIKDVVNGGLVLKSTHKMMGPSACFIGMLTGLISPELVLIKRREYIFI